MISNDLKRHLKLTTVSGMAALTWLVVPATGLAQSAAQDQAEDVTALKPITIYGAKDSTALEDTAASVGIVTADDILHGAIRSYPEAFRRLANVGDGDWNDAGFIIRGVNSEGLVAGSAPLASLYVDGVQQTVAGARRGARGLWDVEQLEVYRGPQSTLSGRAALAGAIYIKTKDPTFEKEAELSGTIGTDNLYGTAFMFNTPLLEDQIALRITGDFQRSKNDINYPTFTGFDRYNDFTTDEYYQLRGKLLIEPAEMPDTKALISYSFSHDSPFTRDIGGPFFGYNYKDKRGDFNDPVFIEDRSTDNHNAGLEITHDISDTLRFTSMTGFTYTFTDRPSVNEGTPGEINVMRGEYRDRLLTQEFRLNYEGDRLKWVGGIYASYENSDAFYDRTTFGARNDFSQSKLETSNLAAFGEATYEFVPTWKITAGGRLDLTRQEVDQFVRRTQPLGGVPSVLTDFDASFSEFNFLPKLGLSKDLTETQTVGFTYSEGFRSGGASINRLTGETYTYDPETASTYEIFYKGRFLEDRLRLNANLFYTKYSDQQVETGQPASSIIVNAASSESWGFEIEPSFDVTSNLSTFVSVGYVHTEFLKADTVAYGSLAGLPFPEAPKWSLGLGGRYTFDNGFYVAGDAKYTSSYLSRFGNLTPFNYLDNRWIANLQAGYKTDRWEINAFAENLLDEDYFVYEDKNLAASQGQGRRVGLNMKVKF